MDKKVKILIGVVIVVAVAAGSFFMNVGGMKGQIILNKGTATLRDTDVKVGLKASNKAEFVKSLVIIMSNYKGIDSPSLYTGCFKDIAGASFENYVCYLNRLGFVKSGDGNFKPYNVYTKAEAAKLLSDVFAYYKGPGKSNLLKLKDVSDSPLAESDAFIMLAQFDAALKL